MKTEYSFVTRVENTPFSIVQTFNEKFAITIGNNVVSKSLDSQEECLHLIEVRDWELITNSVCALINIINDSRENYYEKFEDDETNDKESIDGNS